MCDSIKELSYKRWYDIKSPESKQFSKLVNEKMN